VNQLSVIIPVYFAEKTIGRLCDTLVGVLKKKFRTFEIVLVNDGSTDGSYSKCCGIVRKYPSIVTFVNLSKNFSEHNAVMAGLNHCGGEYAVIIDDDFQNPPEEIIRLYDRIIETGAQVVYSRYEKKNHHPFRNLGSRFNDRVANVMLKKPKGLYLSSFKIIKRNLISEIIKYKGPYPYIDGLILRTTNSIETQIVSHDKRMEGKSNYTLVKLVRLWSNMFINFSVLPLRLSILLGLVFSAIGFIFAGSIIIEKIKNPLIPVGYSSMIVSLMIFSGIILVILGMIGEFLGRLFLTANGMPQYAVSEVVKGTISRKTVIPKKRVRK
jgi:undecaprenyl-phosphate 4-deoxy-4-formamido-L-arabinose transferase